MSLFLWMEYCNATRQTVRSHDDELNRPYLTQQAERVKSVYPPPYLAYYKSPVPEDVQDAIEYVEGILDDEGPFDGVLGFSQGCCVAAALMFERQKRKNDHEPFRFGVFIGASLPFNADDRTGKQVWEAAARSKQDTRNEFAGELELSGKSNLITFPSHNIDAGEELVWLGRYHPDKTPHAKLDIPVLHVIGRKDPYAPQARALAAMHSRSSDATVLEHASGHEVPREPYVMNNIAHQMMKMIASVNAPAV